MPTMLDFCHGLPETTFQPDDVLIIEGESTGTLYVLIEGEVEVLKGDVQVTTVSEPGATVGETSVLLDIPDTSTVKALTPTRVHGVDHASEFLQSATLSPTNSPDSSHND